MATAPISYCGWATVDSNGLTIAENVTLPPYVVDLSAPSTMKLRWGMAKYTGAPTATSSNFSTTDPEYYARVICMTIG